MNELGQIAMELDFKLPKGKPPFIGIRFNNSYAAAYTHHEMADEFRNHLLDMTIDRQGKGVDIKIMLDKPMQIWKYYGVKCDLKKLELFLAIPANQWSFGHMIRPFDTDEIVRTTPNNKLFALKLKGIRMLNEY
jgi:hypothetical protein